MKGKDETIRRLRLGNIKTLLRSRCGYELPDDDAGREYLYELLLPISLGPEADLKMANVMEIWAPWMDAKERFDLVAEIERMPAYVRKITGKTLGKRLRVTSEERKALSDRSESEIGALAISRSSGLMIRSPSRG